MIKDLLGFIKDYGIDPIIRSVGILALGLFGLTLIPSLAFIPKYFVLFILTH